MLFTLDLHRGAPALLLALLILLLSSCQKSNPPAQSQTAGLAPQASRNATAEENAVVPPADAQWTISCRAIGGVNHVEIANALKADLMKGTPLKDWYVIHEDSQSVLYYGFYRSIDRSDPKEAARAHAHLKQIQGMENQSNDLLFPHSFIVEVSTPDPAAPAEWKLTNANGYWSLQIAAYKDSPKRKQFAVDAVREARKQGLPAYYLHGETTSMIFLGAWPRAAVKEQDESTGNAPDPSQPLVVLSEPLPKGAPTEMRDAEGNRVRVLAPRLEPLDPSMIDAMQKYPHNVVNGVVNVSRVKDPATGKMREVPDPSFLVLIPQKQPSLLSGDAPPVQAPAAEITEPPKAAPQGGGKLRSLRD